MGIYINTVTYSTNTTNVSSFSPNETMMKAYITFDSKTSMLVASLQYTGNYSNYAPVNVSAKLPDPTTLLPSEVAVGFSAATGAAFELHQIHSWSFNSTIAAPVQKGIYAVTTSLELIVGLMHCTRWTYF